MSTTEDEPEATTDTIEEPPDLSRVPRMTKAEAVEDHDCNPEYEMHIGKVFRERHALGSSEPTAMRYVSIWIHGERWSGYLTPTHPSAPTLGNLLPN